MCIAAFALNAHPRWRLVVAANRDEYHDRPAAPLARWTDEAGTPILAGRDLGAGGTWLGVNEQSGRLVLITNYRLPGFPEPHRPSRGALVTGLLTGDDPEIVPLAPYNPFTLLYVDGAGGQLQSNLLSNRPVERRLALPPGIHGVSNGPFERPWPKTRQLCDDLKTWLDEGRDEPDALFAALARETPEAVPAPWNGDDGTPEARLAPVFIRDGVYGTRCATVVLVDAEGSGLIAERRFGPEGQPTGETSLPFRWS